MRRFTTQPPPTSLTSKAQAFYSSILSHGVVDALDAVVIVAMIGACDDFSHAQGFVHGM